jgi:hypothetical protein
MESGPSEIATLRWLAAVGAIVTALSVGYVAHYDLGFSRQEIRTQAVIGATIIGAAGGDRPFCISHFAPHFMWDLAGFGKTTLDEDEGISQ